VAWLKLKNPCLASTRSWVQTPVLPKSNLNRPNTTRLLCHLFFRLRRETSVSRYLWNC
jgi:hypothetical protein